MYVSNGVGWSSWRITVRPEFIIQITVDDCVLKRQASISLHDGYDATSDILFKIKNDQQSTDAILSTTNVVYITFFVYGDSKFKLIWHAVSKSNIKRESNVTNNLNCTANSMITVNEGEQLTIASPGYPGGYEANLNCTWTFSPARMGFHVSISILVVDLETVANCVADFVRIESGTDLVNFGSQSQMCSQNHMLAHDRYYGAPNLRVHFQSDGSFNRTGFEAVVALDCGGMLAGTSGEITNEMTFTNRSLYWMNTTCTYIITVARGRTIQFEFEKLKLAKNDDGSCNSYIIIRNGIHDDSPLLGSGKYCSGSASIPATNGNKAIVQYAASLIYRRTNVFILKYAQVEHSCGGRIILDHNRDSVEISSPNYPNIPSAHIECVWRVTAPNGELLKMEFLERFDLTRKFGCLNEYVEVHEGITSTGAIIDRYCKEKPQPIFAASNMMRITYFTDVPIPRNGFKASISFARCGKSLVAVNGFVSSPGYPAKGKPNMVI